VTYIAEACCRCVIMTTPAPLTSRLRSAAPAARSERRGGQGRSADPWGAVRQARRLCLSWASASGSSTGAAQRFRASSGKRGAEADIGLSAQDRTAIRARRRRPDGPATATRAVFADGASSQTSDHLGRPAQPVRAPRVSARDQAGSHPSVQDRTRDRHAVSAEHVCSACAPWSAVNRPVPARTPSHQSVPAGR